MRVHEQDVDELRDRVMRVALAAFAMLARVRDEGYEFTKRTHYPHFQEDSGSSSYRAVTWDSSPHSPLNYTSVFGFPDSYDTQIPYGSIDGVDDLVSFIRSQPDLYSFLWPDRVHTIFKSDYLSHVAARLALDMVERHLHLHGWVPNEQVLEAYYSELVAWWLNERLDIELVVPILAIDFAGDSFVLDADTRVQRLSEGEQLARWPGARLDDNEGYVQMASHALVVSGWWTQPPDHPASMFISEPPDEVDQIDRFLRALSTVTDAPTGYNQILFRPVGWAKSFTANLPPLEVTTLVSNHRSTRLARTVEPSDLIDENRIGQLRAAYSLEDDNKSMRLAAQRLLSAERRHAEADRVVDLCVGLEALLGDSKGETTYKIAIRGAAMLAYSGVTDASQFYRALKRIYDYRSAIVHGSSRPHATSVQVGEASYRTEDLARMVLRRLLGARVAQPDLTPEKIDSALVAHAVDNLAIRPDAPTPEASAIWLQVIAPIDNSAD
jgi:hypothetical protein